MSNTTVENTLAICHPNAKIINDLYDTLKNTNQLFNTLVPMPKHILDLGTRDQQQWMREHWNCCEEAWDLDVAENFPGARDVRVTFNSRTTTPEFIYQALTLKGFIIEATAYHCDVHCDDEWTSAAFLKDYKEKQESK